MFVTGIVQEGDTQQIGKVRIQFPQYDQMISWWLFIAVQKSQQDKFFWCPDVGEQVLCWMDEHWEDGAVLGSIYSMVDMPPGGGSAPTSLKTTPDNAGRLSLTPVVGGSYDAMFISAALLYPSLNFALIGCPGNILLKALAVTESSLNPNAIGPVGRDGVRCCGMLQINTRAHPGYTVSRLLTDVGLNISLGAADLAGKLASTGNINDALARFKGFTGYNESARSKMLVDAVIKECVALGG